MGYEDSIEFFKQLTDRVSLTKDLRLALNFIPLKAPMDYYYVSSKYGYRKDPITKKKNPTERDLLLYPVILPASVEPPHIDLAQRYAPNRLPPLNPQYVTDDFEVVRRIVSETNAFSLVSNPINKFGRLTDKYALLSDLLKMPDQRLAIGVHSRKLHTPALETFKQSLRNSLPEK